MKRPANLTPADRGINAAIADDAAPIDFTKIARAYSGQARKCCCGCAGKHSDDPRTIKSICRKIDRLAAQGYKREESDSYFTLDTETRRYIAYKA
jgi:hypothetical protein